MNTTYYQPEPINGAEWPEELASFQVFKTYDDAFNWLCQHDYDTDDYVITEYHDDDIELPTFIDEYGGEYEKIEDVPDDELLHMIVDEIVLIAGSIDNMLVVQQTGESDQDYEDRLYTDALDDVMEAVAAIEGYDEYDFSTFWPDGLTTDGVAWYDSVREDAIRKVLELMTGETDEW